MTDFLKDPRVLEACGLRLQKYTDPDENYWMDGEGHCRGKHPVLTLSELWEGLCKACKRNETTPIYRPFLAADNGVILYSPGVLLPYCGVLFIDESGPGPDDYSTHPSFSVEKYGTLINCIAAALHWVLQQREG